MSLLHTTHSSRKDAFEAALEAVAGMVDQVADRYLVLSHHAATLWTKKQLAVCGVSLGVEVTTTAHLVGDLWELWGDGRELVGAPERSLQVRLAIQQHLTQNDQSHLVMTDGVVALIESIVKEGLPGILQAHGLGTSEQELVAVATRYDANLKALDLVEYSSALALLANEGVLEQAGIVVVDTQTTALEDALFESAEQVTYCLVNGFSETSPDRADELNEVQETLFAATGETPVEPRGALRFALPAGPYAARPLITQELQRLLADATFKTIAVATRDPLALFTFASARIREATLRCETNLAFEEVDFGRAWCSLVSFLDQGEFPDTFLATDFLLSPFSGTSTQGAYALDARWRGWRGQTVDEAVTDMVGFTRDGFDQIIALVSEGDLAGALASYQAFVVRQVNWSDPYRAQQLQAIAIAQTTLESIDRAGAHTSDYLAVLRGQRITIQMETEASDQEAPVVTFLSYPDLAKHEPATFDAAVLCDLDAASFPLKDGYDAKDALFEKCGLFKPRDLAFEHRSLFARCLAAARTRVLVERTLATHEGDDDLPAFVLEELVDCYRSNLRDPDELHRPFAVPPALVDYCNTLGDDQIEKNVSRDGQATDLDISVPVYTTGFTARSSTGLDLMHKTGSNTSELILSPSAIEAYLECPYQWVVGRRMKSDPLDAGFGALEFGGFAHLVLERFYAKLRAQGALRVTADRVAEAQALLSEVFDAALQEQPELPPQDAILIVQNELEAASVAHLKNNLLDLVKRDASFLPAYHVAQHEVAFGAEEPCEYAGVKVTGRIDRYDIDDLGNAVIIDYKGSVTKSFAYSDEQFADLLLPRKVQGLIYAQILRRQMGLMPQAVLYRSYRRPDIFGTYAHSHFNPFADLEGINADLCAVSDLGAVLDQVEEMIAQRLHALAAGKVEANPVDVDACKFCPLCDAQCSARDPLFCEVK